MSQDKTHSTTQPVILIGAEGQKVPEVSSLLLTRKETSGLLSSENYYSDVEVYLHLQGETLVVECRRRSCSTT